MTLFAVALAAPAFAAAPDMEGVVAKEDGALTVLAQATGPGFLMSANAELAVTPRFTVAGRAGLGLHEVVPVYDLGAEVRYYTVGDFDGGFFVGAGLGHATVTPQTFALEAYTAQAFVGAKYVHPTGLTFEGAAGFGSWLTREQLELGPTGRVGIGWTF